MLGLTNLGTIHTAIALLAVAAGAMAYFRYGNISLRTRRGQAYVSLTVITCLTGFGIFEHGGFGKPHMLGILTLLVLALAVAAGKGSLFGRRAIYVETIAYSLTYFFHFIPATAETATRLPVGAPWADSPEAPQVLLVTGLFFAAFLVGVGLQLRRLRRGGSGAGPAPTLALG
jgi:uncharacterized membrane protein